MTSHGRLRTFTALLALLALTASVPRVPVAHRAAGRVLLAALPYLPGSRIAVRVDGFDPPYRLAVVGPGSVHGDGIYAIPADAKPGGATLIAGNAAGLAAGTVRIAATPSPNRTLIAVASYDDGIVFHDAATFAPIGVLATGGVPADAALGSRGRIAVADTEGDTVTVVSIAPWSVSQTGGVPLGDGVAIDRETGAIFVTNRQIGQSGALTRIAADGTVARVETGQTPEGLVIDERRQIVYVANVNDGTVAAVDARTMSVVRRFAVAPRVFSLVLSADARRLYAISNQSVASPFAAPGAAVAVALSRDRDRVTARSVPLAFPLGEVLDERTHTLFVTDESLDRIDVLDQRTLRRKHAPIPTCHTPWKPTLDPVSERLYVPCARADEIDVLNARTLRRVRGAPFKTGGYPLAVVVWHPRVAS